MDPETIQPGFTDLEHPTGPSSEHSLPTPRPTTDLGSDTPSAPQPTPAPSQPNTTPLETDAISKKTPVAAVVEETRINSSDNTTNRDPFAWNTVKRRPRNNYSRRLKEMQAFDLIFKTKEPFYIKYFTILLPGINIFEDISPIKLDKFFRQEYPGATIKKSGRSGLFVEVSNERQSEKIKQLKTVLEHPVTVKNHASYNQVKGVIRTKCLKHDTEEEILEHLKTQDVINVRRISIKRNSEVITTDTYILTFNLLSCQQTVKLADWLLVKVDDYKYNPRQCFHCLKFGHISKYCRNANKTCTMCATPGHSSDQCGGEMKCLHCASQTHKSTDKNCPKYVCETEIINLQMKNRIPRQEAMNKVFEATPQYETYYRYTNESSRPLPAQSDDSSNVNHSQVVQRVAAVTPPIPDDTQQPSTSRVSQSQTTSLLLESNPKRHVQQTAHSTSLHKKSSINTKPTQQKLQTKTHTPTRSQSQQSYSDMVKRRSHSVEKHTGTKPKIKDRHMRRDSLINYNQREEEGIFMSIDNSRKRGLTSPEQGSSSKKSNLTQSRWSLQRLKPLSYTNSQQKLRQSSNNT